MATATAPATASTKRTEADPRVKRIMAAFDRAAASPKSHRCDLESNLASSVMSLGATYELFDVGRSGAAWRSEGLREVLLACVLNAPSSWLTTMAEIAKEELALAEEYERDAKPARAK